MGVQVRKLEDSDDAILQCTTTDAVLSLVINYELAEEFVEQLPQDARLYSDAELHDQWLNFIEKVDKLRKTKMEIME